MALTRSQLKSSAEALCQAFASNAPLSTLMSHFSTSYQISAVEHGEPFLAPFLGRPFSGRRGPNSVSTYFSLLQKYLKFEDMTFGSWVIDDEVQKVCVKGRATFTWVEGKGEGQSWEEEFVYMLDFDDDGKVTDYQVWADSGAAYLAQTGELSEKQKSLQDPADTKQDEPLIVL